MKKVLITAFSILLIAVLAACGSTDDKGDVSNPPKDVTDDQQTNENGLNDSQNNDITNNGAATDETNDKLDINEKMKELSFAEIELNVEYSEKEEYEAEVEKKSTGEYKAEVEDDITNIYLKGEEAFEHLHPILQGLNINSDSTKQEVIDAVLESFDLADDYKEFEVEITFQDGTKMEYEDKK